MRQDRLGLATSYLYLLDINATNVVGYSLSSLFLKTPEGMANCRFEDLTASFLYEVRRRWPYGPCNLGGWYPGAISGCDAVEQLVADCEVVERLILIGTLNPICMAELPSKLYVELDGLNLFQREGRTSRAQLFPHLLGSLDILDTYVPEA